MGPLNNGPAPQITRLQLLQDIARRCGQLAVARDRLELFEAEDRAEPPERIAALRRCLRASEHAVEHGVGKVVLTPARGKLFAASMNLTDGNQLTVQFHKRRSKPPAKPKARTVAPADGPPTHEPLRQYANSVLARTRDDLQRQLAAAEARGAAADELLLLRGGLVQVEAVLGERASA